VCPFHAHRHLAPRLDHRRPVQLVSPSRFRPADPARRSLRAQELAETPPADRPWECRPPGRHSRATLIGIVVGTANGLGISAPVHSRRDGAANGRLLGVSLRGSPINSFARDLPGDTPAVHRRTRRPAPPLRAHGGMKDSTNRRCMTQDGQADD